MTEQFSSIGSVNAQLSLLMSDQPIKFSRRENNDETCIQLHASDCNQLQTSTELPSAVAEYVSASLADKTRLAYRGDLADFIAFGGEIPCTPEQLCIYIAERAKNHSPFTIARRVVGISRAHTSQGILDPAKNDLVRAVLRGVRRTHGKPQRQVSPLLKSDLLAILPSMHGTKGARDRALILLGFAAALRRSELVNLNVEDIVFSKDGLVLYIRRSKTDQAGEGRKIAVPYARSCYCPVKAVKNWCSIAKITTGPIFRPVKKNGGVSSGRLTSQVLALVLKAYATSVGLDAANFSGHSLRAGLVTSAAIAGVSSWKIKAQTGHRSDAMIARYVRDTNLFVDNAASAVL
jgi:integrase